MEQLVYLMFGVTAILILVCAGGGWAIGHYWIGTVMAEYIGAGIGFLIPSIAAGIFWFA